MKNYFKFLKNDNEDEDNKNKAVVSFSDYHGIKYLNVFDGNTSFKFDGRWNDFFESKEDLLKSLKAMPLNLRFYGVDNLGYSIIDFVLWNRKEWYTDDLEFTGMIFKLCGR